MLSIFDWRVKVEYRTNKRTGDRISVIGLGTSYIAETEEKRGGPGADPLSMYSVCIGYGGKRGNPGAGICL